MKSEIQKQNMVMLRKFLLTPREWPRLLSALWALLLALPVLVAETATALDVKGALVSARSKGAAPESFARFTCEYFGIDINSSRGVALIAWARASYMALDEREQSRR
jgi:hypothetical protein